MEATLSHAHCVGHWLFLWIKNAPNDTDMGSKSQAGEQLGQSRASDTIYSVFRVTTGTHQSLPGTSSRRSVATERFMPCTEH
jgi:hypothetical protein